jgi:hypothetical protein
MKLRHYFPAAAATLMATTSVFSANWTATTGDWDTPGNWQNYMVPSPTDTVSVSNGGQATIKSPVTILELDLGFAGNGTLTIERNGSLTTTRTESGSINNIGQRNGSIGTLNINGGSFRSYGGLDGTSAVNDVAEFNLSSGSFVVQGPINASRAGKWRFNVSGGTFSVFEIRGHPTVRGTMNFTNSGTFSIGEIGITGRSTYADIEMTFNPGSNLHFDIGGTNPAEVLFQDGPKKHDALFGNGSFKLQLNNCNLLINLIDGFEERILYTDKLTIIKAQKHSISGTFANVIDGRVFTADGRGSFSVTQKGDQITLSQYQSENSAANVSSYKADIPEPRHFAMLLGVSMLVGLLFNRSLHLKR